MSVKKSEYDARYQRDNTVVLSVRLSRKYDADIIAYLSSFDGSRSAAVKEALRAYLISRQNCQFGIDK